MMDLSVVIPLYNEEESLPHLVERLHATLSRLGLTYEIVLVDDGSTDRSWEVLVGFAKTLPHLRLIRFRRNFGQTAALSAGFRESQGKVIVTLDADLQNDPADIPKLLERIAAGCDVVSGWRRHRKDPFLNRRLPSRLANSLISKITGVYLHDYGCTLKAYRREVIQNIRLYGEMHRFIPALASWVGGRIDEVAVNHAPRRYGRSKYGIARTLRVVLDLITVKFLLRYSTGPMQIFGKAGLFFALLGMLLIAAMAAANLSYQWLGPSAGSDPTNYPFWVNAASLIKRPFWVMTAFMLIFFGVQFISMGLLAEIQIRTYHESQDKPIYVIRETIVSST